MELIRTTKRNVLLLFVLFSLLPRPCPGSSPQQYSLSEWKHEDGLQSSRIYAITQTTDGFLWLGTADGLIRFDGFQFLQQPLTLGDMQPLGRVYALAGGREGSLFIGTASGWIIRSTGQQQIRVPLREAVIHMRLLGNDELEVTTERQIWRLSVWDLSLISRRSSMPVTTDLPGCPGLQADRSVVLRSVTKTKVEVTSCLRESNGNTWFGSFSDGLYMKDQNGTITQFDKRNGLTSESVTDLYKDREANIWVGTSDGLNRLRPDKFRTISLSGLGRTQMPSAVFVSGEKLWLESPVGLQQLSPDGVTVATFYPHPVTACTGDGQGGAFAAAGKHLIHLSSKGAVLGDMELSAADVGLMAISSDRRLWLYSPSKGLRVTGDMGGLVDVPLSHLGQHHVVKLATAGSSVWMAREDGLLLRYENGKETELPLNMPSLTVVNQLLPLADGRLWIATDTGLLLYDGQRILRWDKGSGLPGTRVQWVAMSDRDSVWLGYSLGVAQLSLDALLKQTTGHNDHLTYRLYDDGDGILGTPEMRGASAVAQAADKSLWFTVSDGVAHVMTRHIALNHLAPPVHILSLLRDGRPVSLADGLALPFGTRSIEITYAALSLTDPHKVKFRYRLDGFDESWQEADGRNSVFYANLPPGKYGFHVIACNNDGIWNDAGDSLAFTIRPAFYQTGLFRVAVVFIAVMGLVVAYRVRLAQRERTLRAEMDIRLEERTAIARDLHDHLLQEILAVGLQLELADAAIEKERPARSFIARALELTRSSMKRGRGVLQALRSESLTWPAVQRALQTAADDVTPSGSARLRFEVKEEPISLSSFAGEQILLIAQEAIRNAIAHAPGSPVTVTATFQRTHFLLAARDQGPGLTSALEQTEKEGHFGIQGMYERAAMIEAVLSIASVETGGTEWLLKVPAVVAYSESTPWSRQAPSLFRRWLSR